MKDKEKIEKLQEIINRSKRIVFFGGAGVSTESGIPDFRSKDGLYNMKYKKAPEYMLSHTCFVNEVEEFYRFYFDKMVFDQALPNDCHKKLKELEDKGKLRAIITQNIDGLHQAAGSKNVLELHGNVYRLYCTDCKQKYDLKDFQREGVLKCSCGGIIKPDVVLYEEPLDNEIWSQAIEEIQNCDTLIVGGTSLVVYPAASLIQYFQGNDLVVINKDELALFQASLVIHDNIGEVFRNIR